MIINLLIDSDIELGRYIFPNLALMQLSTFLKDLGQIVEFGSTDKIPDNVWVSCVFPQNREKALMSSNWYPESRIHFGGTGFNLITKLPEEAQHKKPDYGLYPHVDYSLGFTSRGCIRKCAFCVVPEKEGFIREHSPIEEFLEPSFKKIVLLDNNFLASPRCKEKLEKLIDLGKRVCFNQGLDIRLINKENAELLAQVKSRDKSFKRTNYYFAWDLPEIEPSVLKGIEILLDAGIKPSHLMFYVLMGYNTNYEQDKYRLHTLIDLGVKPYVMVYNQMEGTYHKHMRRWVKYHLYEHVPWLKYDYGNSQEVIKRYEGLIENFQTLEQF